MKAGSHLERVLDKGMFAITGEFNPPGGNDVRAVERKADLLKDCVDAVNVTDNQSAMVRMSSVAASSLLIQMGLEPVMQMTTRDRNRIAIQSDLMGATALGIKNVVCLTGDHHSFGNQVDSKNVHDLDSIQLIDCVRTMRDQGTLLGGVEKIEGEIRLFIGAVENPFADPFEFRALRLGKKVRAGADFIQTQCIYDMDRFKEWMKRVQDRGLHEKCRILAGISPLNSERIILQCGEKTLRKVPIPEGLVGRITKSKDPREEGIRVCVEQIQELKEIKGIHGIHLMGMDLEEQFARIVDGAGLLPRPKVE
ncbi:MAG TPA: methylenetetrahydrofolate reductase [Thermodesulfobacteriota bacterium]|nr:methylenetetrahydrofolate reductase [Thermodesulfobacteriota bacterium]